MSNINCQKCGCSMARIPRSMADRLIGMAWKNQRVVCVSCGFEHLAFNKPEIRTVAYSLLVGALALLAGALVGGAVMAAGYALRNVISTDSLAPPLPVYSLYKDKPTALYTGQQFMGAEMPLGDARMPLQRTLNIRSGCVWGKPGADPYTGSIENALATPGLPDEVVRSMADKIRRKKRSGVVQISNDGISTAEGRYFGKTAATMTYGKTVCFNTRINFARGHVEYADLYDTWDSQGMPYSVMVPYVCGNVSVLMEQPRAAEGQVRTVPEPGSMVLFVSALLGTIAFRHRRSNG